jgi:hypothetical protein
LALFEQAEQSAKAMLVIEHDTLPFLRVVVNMALGHARWWAE